MLAFALHCIALPVVVLLLPCPFALHGIALRCIALHGFGLCIALHLHSIGFALHGIASISMHVVVAFALLALLAHASAHGAPQRTIST